MRILILGTTGLLGYALYNQLKEDGYSVFGTIRKHNSTSKRIYSQSIKQVNNLLDENELNPFLEDIKPDIVINCLSLEKINESSLSEINNIFSNFPHMLNKSCRNINAKIIQISSDAVFSGNTGNYCETDTPDPIDEYGRAKLKGELYDQGNLTIRTSMIGHSFFKNKGLLDWFLNQETCSLYTKAIFSGLTVNEISRIISTQILSRKDIEGLFHLSSDPISKYDLLSLVNEIYKSKVNIRTDSSVIIDRSLSSEKFRDLTGYKPPNWEDLIVNMMHESILK